MLSIDTIAAQELDIYVNRSDTIIIDLRERDVYDKSHFRTAVNVPYEELEICRKFPRQKLLIVYCERGSTSLFAARALMKMGFRVKSVVGGIRCYQASTNILPMPWDSGFTLKPLHRIRFPPIIFS